MPVCRNCGSRLSKFDKDICPICGIKNPLDGVSSDTVEITAEIASVKSEIKNYQPKSRGIAFVLSLFIGWTGAPYFYLKYMMNGLIWMIINLGVAFGFFALFYFLISLELLISIVIPIGIVYLLNLCLGLFFLYHHDLKDGRGEFLR